MNAKARKQKFQIATGDITITTLLNDDKTITVSWQINSDEPVFWDWVRCNRNDGNPLFIISPGYTGCSGYLAPKTGSFIDHGEALEFNVNTGGYDAIQKPFVSGDQVSYEVVASMGTLDTHDSLFSPMLTVLVP